MAKKTLCGWNKTDIKEKNKKLRKIIGKPTHYCRQCARVASDEAYLCKPEPLQ